MSRPPGLTLKPRTWCGSSSQNLKREGRTIFLCTHNLDEADRLCDRVGVFKTRLLVLDSPAALRKSVFGRKVVFHLGDAKDCMVDGLLQLPFVKEAKRVDNKLVVQLDDPDKNNPEIVRYLVDGRRGCPVHRGIALFAGRSLFATGKECLRLQ